MPLYDITSDRRKYQMATLTTRLRKRLTSRKGQLTVFAGVAALTALLVGTQVLATQSATTGGKKPPKHTPPVWKPAGGNASHSSDVALQAALSQSKLVQGENGALYVNLSIVTPDGEGERAGNTATDFVVVLDRSPSMLAANKLPYAKAAVRELISKLDAADRFALIAFDRRARVYSELVEMTPSARQHLMNMVDNLGVGSATNIGAGLMRARELIAKSPSPRVKKILLLSDGETNTGITDPNALAKMASDIASQQIVLSAIGMGLGFNEALMASLADHGMGNYSYLEHLSTLGRILAKDLDDTRLIYAENSELHLQLQNGVQLHDAAGYPLETIGGDAAHVRIKTGQLLQGARKSLILSLTSPTATTGDFTLGNVTLQYRVNGVVKHSTLEPQHLAYAVVEPSKKPEAKASISSDVYRKTWLSNNLGRMRQQVYRWVKEGNKVKAQSAIDNYRRELQGAEEESGLRLKNETVEKDVAEMENRLEDAFSGAPAAQAVKRNSLSKSMQYQGRQDQRK
jgi:Ca-activated chloride channel family protein